jgi:hypothetical protein
MGLLVVVFVVFVALVAVAPQQVVQIFLVFAWGGALIFAVFPIFKALGRLF